MSKLDKTLWELYQFGFNVALNPPNNDLPSAPTMVDQAEAEIVKLFEEAIPEKRPVEIKGIVEGMGYEPTYIQNEMTSRLNAAYNKAIDDIRAKLKEALDD